MKDERMTTFASLSLHATLEKTLERNKFDTPTPVQAQAIPPALAGKDVLACAQTGTGKTAAFTLPMLHLLLKDTRPNKPKGPQVLVLTPTRELADQVMKNIKTFAENTGLKTGMVVGGMPYAPQIRMLDKGLDILVSTPGRLIDHVQEGVADLSNVEMLVLDEADRMLDMGFVKPVETIISKINKKPQTMLFSATFSTAVQKLAQRFLNKPVEIKLASSEVKHDNITQNMLYTLDQKDKLKHLEAYFADKNIWQAIVFMKTKHSTERMAKNISQWGLKAAALNGDMKQNARKRVIKQMHDNNIQVLVATDVAARGLDVKALSHVINFDLPQVAEDYIHRIGRTGRAGAKGDAISFVNADEYHLLKDIEKLIASKIYTLNEPPVGFMAASSKGGKKSGGGRNKGGRSGGGYNAKGRDANARNASGKLRGGKPKFGKPAAGSAEGGSEGKSFGNKNHEGKSSAPRKSFGGNKSYEGKAPRSADGAPRKSFGGGRPPEGGNRKKPEGRRPTRQG